MTKKILCIGNNTVDTDIKTTRLAQQDGCQAHGLLSELDGPIKDPQTDGYYHTSVYDIQYHKLLELATKFDLIIVLDQSFDQYLDHNGFHKTIQLANEIAKTTQVKYLDPEHAKGWDFFQSLVHTNKSFCIFPFIELLVNNGETRVCCRSTKKITRLQDLVDFQTDKDYMAIRKKMLDGEKLSEHCESCYALEAQGILSARQVETVEWANRLQIKNLDDLLALKQPAYYEVRPSNICNLQCRSCNPTASHLIAKEYRLLKFDDKNYQELEYTNFDFVNFDNLHKLYVAGGEPTAMPEFYDFLDKCINDNKTNFELMINTNGTKLSDRLRQKLKKFDLVSFIFSIDGFENLNHYVRWPSDWNKIINNASYVYLNHKLTFNVTVSIYNVLTLYELLQFLETKFPAALVHCQFAVTPDDRLSALNFPESNSVLQKLRKILHLNCYKNDPLLTSFVDGLITHYSRSPTVDLHKLEKFYQFNDMLDKSRNISLRDYVPELDDYRRLLNTSH